MIDWTALAAFALLGLAGSLHCVGMCGGFVLAVTGQGRARGRVLSRALIFGVGKALTYAVLGLMLAQLAGRVTEVSGLQRYGAWIAGTLLILLGVSSLFAPARNLVRNTRVARAFGSLLHGAEQLGGAAGAFGAGVVTGFLPCGLSLGAFVLATQVPAPTAAVGLFLFGLATTPSLAALALGWGLLSVRTRAAGVRALALLWIAFGVITVMRGRPYGVEAAPACCEPPTAPLDSTEPADSAALRTSPRDA